MNPNVKFKFPVAIGIIYSIGMSLVFMLIIAGLLSIWKTVYTLRELISTIGFSVGILVAFFVVAKASASDQEIAPFLQYFKFKRLFSKYKLTSIQDIIVATDGEYADFTEIRDDLLALQASNCISGFKIEKDGTFTFYDRKKYQKEAKVNRSTTLEVDSTTPFGDELTTLSNLRNQGIISEDDFQTAKNKILNRL